MRRVLIPLFLLLLLGGASFLVTRHCLAPSSPSGWLCFRYGLDKASVGKIEGLERSYGSRCGPYCDAMCTANARLETLALDSVSVTPELRSAIAETDRIRTEARIAMLDHFYAIAGQLPPEKRRDYLLKVLPLVVDSCGRR